LEFWNDPPSRRSPTKSLRKHAVRLYDRSLGAVERRKSADIAGSLLLAEAPSESLTLVCHPVASKPAVAADQNCKEIRMVRNELIAPALLLVIAGATAQAADMLSDFRNSLLQVIRPDIQQLIQRRARDEEFHLRVAENFPRLVQGGGVSKCGRGTEAITETITETITGMVTVAHEGAVITEDFCTKRLDWSG